MEKTWLSISEEDLPIPFPLTPFYYFLKRCAFEEYRHLKLDRKMKYTDFSKLCADRWALSNESEKRTYREIADRENEIHKNVTAIHNIHITREFNSEEDHDIEIKIKIENEAEKEEEKSKISTDNENEVNGDDAARKARILRKRIMRRLKDPNAPKRYMSSYFHFLNIIREDVIRANPTFTIGDIARHVGGLWRGMGEEKKKFYTNLAAQDRIRFTKEIAAYKLRKMGINEDVTATSSSAASSQMNHLSQ